MKTVNYIPTGEPLKISFIFNGLIAASYTYTLWAANSNTEEETHTGNNKNPEDDVYDLPSPCITNEGRLIEFSVSFKGSDPNNFKDYSIKAEIYQKDELICSEEDKGKVTGKPQDTLMFFLLNSQ